MNLWRRKLRLAALAGAGVVAMIASGCASNTGSGSSSAGTPIKGGTATVALPPSTTYNWIFPFYDIANSSSYDDEQFQWLMYRPLYMFGNDTTTDVSINYPLSPAEAPVYTDGGKTVTITMKGWKWSNGETVDAADVVFFLNMAQAEKSIWYAYASGLLPDNVVSYSASATDPNTLTIHLNAAYSSLWYTYNQLAEINPMPMAWDVSAVGGGAGSGGCTKDSAADSWAKCKAVYTFMTAQSTQESTYATNPLWQVVDGPWKLSVFNTDGNVTMVPNPAYSGSPKPQLDAVKFVPFTADTAEYSALKSGHSLDVGEVPKQDLPLKPANSLLPATNPLASAGYTLSPWLNYGIQYAQPNFNNPQVGYLVRQLYIRQALQMSMDQPGIDKAIYNGYASPGAGPIPMYPANQFIPAVQNENGGQGPYPFNLTKAKDLLTSHGWSEVNGVMTCQDPSKCGTGITQGQQLALTYVYASGQTTTTELWQAIKSDASKVGIDLTVQAQSFDTIVGESNPCAPMGPKCNVQVFAYGGWGYNGPGFEPTGESLFQTGAGSNSGNYSDSKMDSLINATHTSNSPTAFSDYATYAAQQLPFLWVPSGNPYRVIAVTNSLKGVAYNPLFTMLPEYWYFTK